MSAPTTSKFIPGMKERREARKQKAHDLEMAIIAAQPKNHLTALPLEILEQIHMNLEPMESLRLGLTCQKHYAVHWKIFGPCRELCSIGPENQWTKRKIVVGYCRCKIHKPPVYEEACQMISWVLGILTFLGVIIVASVVIKTQN